MTVQIKLIGMAGPPNKAAHVEIFKHEDRQQIVQSSYFLQEGDEQIITLYEGVGVRINEVEVEVEQDEIPTLLHDAPADDTPVADTLG